MLTFELPQTLISAEPSVFKKKGSSKVNIGGSKVTIFAFFLSFGTINSRKNSLVAQRSPPTLACLIDPWQPGAPLKGFQPPGSYPRATDKKVIVSSLPCLLNLDHVAVRLCLREICPSCKADPWDRSAAATSASGWFALTLKSQDNSIGPRGATTSRCRQLSGNDKRPGSWGFKKLSEFGHSSLQGHESSQSTGFTLFWCNQRGTDDLWPISADFLNHGFLGLLCRFLKLPL